MNITVNEFINDFAYKLNTDKTSVFIGSGVSTELNLPNWEHLFKDIASKMSLDIKKIDNYYQLSQYYCNKYSIGDLKKQIAPKLRTTSSESTTLDALLKLGFESIWTTNFDTTIENCLLRKNIKYTMVHNDRDLSCINPNDCPVIYKINGDINDLENLILTQHDWENFEFTRPTMLTFLKKELVSNTFLFLGYSFKDGLVKSALSNIRQYVGDSTSHHYVIFDKSKDEEFPYFIDDLEKNYNVKTVLVDSYEEVPNILSQIYNKTIEKNIFISGRLDDYDQETERFANQLLSQLSVDLLKNNYNISSGMGRKIGYFVTGPSIQYLLSCGIKNIDRRLHIRPFDDNLKEEDFSLYRKYLIDQNNIVIFVFGQKFVNNVSECSRGVLEEFEIAQNMNKIIIPIGSTGFAAKEIFNVVKADLTRYPYIEPYINILENEMDIFKVSKTIISIIQSRLKSC